MTRHKGTRPGEGEGGGHEGWARGGAGSGSSEENRGRRFAHPTIPRVFLSEISALVPPCGSVQMGFPPSFFLQNKINIRILPLAALGSLLSSFGTQPRDSNWQFGLTSEAPVPPRGVATSSCDQSFTGESFRGFAGQWELVGTLGNLGLKFARNPNPVTLTQ